MPAMAGAAARELPADIVLTAVFWTFIAGLAWVPFWFGSNVLLAWGINAVLFPGLVIAFELALLFSGARHPVTWRAIAFPFVCLALVFVFIVMQIAVSAPHSFHHPIWDMAADVLGRPVSGSISVNRDLTLQALLRLVTAASVFWLALQFGRHPARANKLLIAVTMIGAGYAAYGLVARDITPGHVLWVADAGTGSFVSSTFYNRNHFAIYTGMSLIVAFGLLIRLYRGVAPKNASPRLRAAAFLETTGKSGAFHISIVTVLAAALMLTGSRGGIVSFFAGCLVLVFLTFGRRTRTTGEQFAVIGLFGLLVAAVFVVFGDAFFGKIEHLGFGDESRLAIYRLTAESILHAPFLGYGYGTFADVFPMFRDRSVDIAGIWTAAHNTYLEVLQGLGLIFGTLLIAAVALLAMRCIAGARTRKAGAIVPAIAGSVACMIGLSALVDFSLEIQAVTLTFMAILGVGIAQSISSRVDLQD